MERGLSRKNFGSTANLADADDGAPSHRNQHQHHATKWHSASLI